MTEATDTALTPLAAWPPTRDDVVIRYLLERNAKVNPEHVTFTFHTGERWTAAETLDEAFRTANGFRRLGIQQGDVVGLFGTNGPDLLRVILGLHCVGAISVPMNGAWRGGLLRHAIDTTQPELVIAGSEHAKRIEECGSSVTSVDLETIDRSDPSEPTLERPIEPWDPAVYQFTSGTTGPSKAAILSNQHVFLTGSFVTLDPGLGSDDTFLMDLPLTHLTALCVVVTCIAGEITVALREMPSLSNYWEVAKETGATAAFLLSSMVPVLLAAPPAERDRNHGVKLMMSAPLPPDVDAFMARFGVEAVITGFGSTETGGPICSRREDPIVAGSVGRQRFGWQTRVVDENDLEVPVGTVGELVVRADEPWCLNNGYVRNAEATVVAWRNGWFHTGDLVKQDEDGNFFFIDRAKDALRRRGENISTYEVEVELAAHPQVSEVACVGVPSPSGSDDEVKVYIVPRAGETVDFWEVTQFLVPRMPHYMLPRYYELIDELPKSPTLKVQKFLLRERGQSDSTWDLEVDGGHRSTSRGLLPVGAPDASS